MTFSLSLGVYRMDPKIFLVAAAAARVQLVHFITTIHRAHTRCTIKFAIIDHSIHSLTSSIRSVRIIIYLALANEGAPTSLPYQGQREDSTNKAISLE